MTVTLRPYQTKLLDDIRNALRTHKRVVGCMSTGAGKGTTIAAVVASAAAKGHRTLVLAHRAELIDQLSDSLAQWDVPHGTIRAGKPLTDELVQVGSVQTVARRLDRMPEPHLIVQDEAHHLIEGNTWGKVIDYWPNAYLVGKTATPARLSGEGLGEGHGGYFQALVEGPSAQWLTDNGFLAPSRVFAPPSSFKRGALGKRAGDYQMGQASNELSKREIMGDVIAHFRRHFPEGGTAIAFCCSIEHAETVAAEFSAAGIAAASIDGRMTADQRRGLLQQLQARTIRVLTSCSLIGEGINVPNVDGCLLLRPTMSLALHLQMIGRCLRPAPGKSHAVVLDHVGNCLAHGLPTDPREWSLEGKAKRTNDAPPVRVCKNCYAANPGAATHCQECGEEFPVQTAAEIEQIAGELAELAPTGWRIGDTVLWRGDVWYIHTRPVHGKVVIADSKSRRDSLHNVVSMAELTPTTRKPKHPAAGCRTYEDLLAVEQAKGYRPGWARHIYAARRQRWT